MNDATTRLDPRPFPDSRTLLQAELAWLDDALRHLIRGLARPGADDGGHGWFISAQEAEQLLCARRRSGADAGELEPLRARRREILARRVASAAEGTSLAQLRLAQTFQLSPFEELILLACLAPELDAKYGRVYGYLHDDLTRRQPSLQLIASVARLYEELDHAERLLLGPDLPVFRWQLVSLQGDAAGHHRLAQGLSIDPRIAGFLLEAPQPDARIQPYLRRLPPLLEEEAGANGQDELVGQLERLLAERRQAVVYFHGPGAAAGRRLAQRVCRKLGAELLRADLGGHGARCTQRRARLRRGTAAGVSGGVAAAGGRVSLRLRPAARGSACARLAARAGGVVA